MLEKPYSVRECDYLTPIPEGCKRCRICQDIKPLEQFRTLTHRGKSWPYYACNNCSRNLQRQAYLRRKSKKHDGSQLPVAGQPGNPETI